MFNQRADTRSYKVLQRQKIENLTYPPTSPTNTFDREAIISPYPVVGVVIQVASGLQSAHMSLYEGLFLLRSPFANQGFPLLRRVSRAHIFHNTKVRPNPKKGLA